MGFVVWAKEMIWVFGMEALRHRGEWNSSIQSNRPRFNRREVVGLAVAFGFDFCDLFSERLVLSIVASGGKGFRQWSVLLRYGKSDLGGKL